MTDWEFYFENGHCVFNFPGNVELSMTNYIGAHCQHPPGVGHHYSNGDMEISHRPVRSRSVEVLVRKYSEDGKTQEDLTKRYFPDAFPDAANISLSKIIEVMNDLMKGGA